MSYVPTRLQRELVIDAVVTIHYFEYMRDFVFPGESHDFWEFLYVDKGTVLVTAGERDYKLGTGEIIFHKPNEFHAIRSIGKKAPNLVAVSFLSSSLSMKRLESRIDTLSLTEREIISHLLALARQCFASPLHVPSVEQITLKKELPFGSPQLILMYLEMLLLPCFAPVCGLRFHLQPVFQKKPPGSYPLLHGGPYLRTAFPGYDMRGFFPEPLLPAGIIS